MGREEVPLKVLYRKWRLCFLDLPLLVCSGKEVAPWRVHKFQLWPAESGWQIPVLTLRVDTDYCKDSFWRWRRFKAWSLVKARCLVLSAFQRWSIFYKMWFGKLEPLPCTSCIWGPSLFLTLLCLCPSHPVGEKSTRLYSWHAPGTSFLAILHPKTSHLSTRPVQSSSVVWPSGVILHHWSVRSRVQLFGRGWPQTRRTSIHSLVLGPQMLGSCWRVDEYCRKKAYKQEERTEDKV